MNVPAINWLEGVVSPAAKKVIEREVFAALNCGPQVTDAQMKLNVIDVLIKHGAVPNEVYDYADHVGRTIDERKLETIFDEQLGELALETGKVAEDLSSAIHWTKFMLRERGFLQHVGLDGEPSLTKHACILVFCH
jgi:hypothetical protein